MGVITGEVGEGKTVAAREEIEELDEKRDKLLYVRDETTGKRGI